MNNTVYIKPFLQNIHTIFSTMAFSEIDGYEVFDALFTKRYEICAAMIFSNNRGRAYLFLEDSVARCIAMNMLGMPEEALALKDINDSVCEVLNMICGNSKSMLAETEYYFEISVPFIPDTVPSGECSEIAFNINGIQNYLQLSFTKI